MGAAQTNSRSAARLALVTPPPASPDAPTGVPAGLRLLRSLDRAVLEVARDFGMRPMELYALLLLSDAAAVSPVTTRRLADLLAASSSQAKQLALRLCAAGYAMRLGSSGRTALTPAGWEIARRAERALAREIERRLGGIDSGAIARGTASLASLGL